MANSSLVHGRNLRKSTLLLAASTAALSLTMATANANDILFDGVGGQFFNFSPLYMDAGNILEQKVEVDVDTMALDNLIGFGLGYALGARANGEIDVDASQNVEALGNSIWVINFLDFTDKDAINITSSALTRSTAGVGILVDDARGETTIDGGGTGVVSSFLSGIYVDTWVDPAGTVTIKDFAGITSTAGNGIWVPVLGDANIDIHNVGPITAGIEGVFTAAVNGNTSIDTTSGKVTAGGDGIAHSWGGYSAGNTGTGSLDIKTGDVEAGLVGVFGYTLSGNNSIDTTAGSVDAGTNGVAGWVFAGSGAVDIKTADVDAAGIGVWSRSFNGDSGIDTTAGKVTSGLDGVIHASLGYTVGSNLGNSTIITGDVDAGAVGVFAYTNVGNNNIDTTAGTVDAGTNGVAGWVFAGVGNAVIKTADVVAVGIGVWSRTWDGDGSIDTTAGTVDAGLDGVIHASLGYTVGSNAGGSDIKTADVNSGLVGVFAYTNIGDNTVDTTAGTIDAGTDGIAAWALGGNVNVNAGEVIAASTGIWAANTLAGTNTVTANGNVTGNLVADWGILSTTLNGSNTVDIKGVTVKGNAALEVTTLGTGAVNTTIDAASLIDGTTWGYVTTTITGLGTTNNSGTIKTTADSGAPGVAGSPLAVYVKGGTNNVINNLAGGVIIGGFTTAGINMTFNNEAGGTWDPSLLNAFAAVNDTVNNAGLINVRKGFTNVVGLENLTNESGGVINMRYDASGTLDDLVAVGDLQNDSGSFLSMDVDFAAAPAYADNHSSYGLGDADTIYAITANGDAAVTVNLNFINRATQNGLIATSGSIALIDVGTGLATAGMVDPGLGGLPTLIPSGNYVFGTGDPSSAAVKIVLQEDGNGGLYLRWAPNITAHSMGGFAGGDMDDPSTGAARMSGAAGVLGGAGGGLGASGGPSGGGAAGQVGDIAAQNSYGQSGASGAAFCGDGSRTTAWVAADGADTKFSNTTKGWNAGSAFGLDYDVTPDACGKVAIGGFGSFSTSASSFETGTSDTESKGLGAYVRFAPGNGLYATALVAANWGESELTNNIFGSTANQDSFGMLVNGAVGYSTALGDSASFDIRAFASRAWIDGDGFTDSAGIVVDGSEADMTAVGAMATLSYDVTQSTSAFLSGGLRHVTMDHSVTAFGIEISGKAEANYASVEAGLRHALSDNAALSISGNGDFSKDSESWGGRVGLAFKF